jgi:alpha-glucan,water dikinase
MTVQMRDQGFDLEIDRQAGPPCILHWGFVRQEAASWCQPPKSAWPPGSTPADRAVDTPLPATLAGFTLPVEAASRFAFFEFALYDAKASRWDSNQGRNYRLALPPPVPIGRTPTMVTRALLGSEAPSFEGLHRLAEGYTLAVAAHWSEAGVEVALATDVEGPLLLHWGVGADRRQWTLPPEPWRPLDSKAVDQSAVRTPFRDEGEVRTLHIAVASGELPRWLSFVLWQPGQGRWWNDHGQNFSVPLKAGPAERLFANTTLENWANQIVEAETGNHSWTLMHRFNLAWELLDRVSSDDLAGLALLFVWLRFSAIRQLDWQRKFNTQPRELAHAQDRLTIKLAERAAQSERGRYLLRMIAGTLGRGGDGQRVRDGILEIMHRNHVKEVSGHFLEEWHQKLHNNTTPDDVVICQAYLAFLRQNGDTTAFYKTLDAGGVTRERFLGYERPIRSQPDFVPHLRDALLHDFGDFLGILSSVHLATDFATALQLARGFLEEPTRRLLDEVWRRRGDAQSRGWLLEAVTRARENLASQLRPGRAGLRDLFYLDISLEDFLRSLVERNLHESLLPGDLLAWLELSLRNLACTRQSDELALSLRHLQREAQLPHAGQEFALRVQAVLERIRRELVALADCDGRLLQSTADYLGGAFAAAPWTVRLFAEEVLRGGIEFVVSALARKLDGALRAIAGLGHWQVTSRGHGGVEGVVRQVATLAEVQGHSFEPRTVLIAANISGEEEIPQGVVAMLTEATVDLMSHVAVRARNAEVLLATGWDSERMAKLRARQDQWIRLTVRPSGELTDDPIDAPTAQAQAKTTRTQPTLVQPAMTRRYAVGEAAFDGSNVGGKSRNLKQLRGRLPEWIHVPAAAALPFGVCERVLQDPINQAMAERHHALVAQLAGAAEAQIPSTLAAVRDVLFGLAAPPELEGALQTTMTAAALPWPEAFRDVWLGIKRVWASKWNERAYFSRRARGIPDAQLFMAVLVQEVVQADYAFVVHTANPVTGDRDELVAEMVLGLGETLVGNQPGHALGFVHRRGDREPRMTSFPSKSVGLYGRGLMFRSDSNGEDLVGFAGAGLYDSVAVPEAQSVTLDYAKSELLWNEDLRRRVLDGVIQLGRAVEGALGSAQDIEGAYAHGQFFVLQARPQIGLGGLTESVGRDGG